MNYKGVIIEESLDDDSVLKDVLILETKIEAVTERHQSSEKQWTLHTVEIPENNVENIAEQIGECIKNKWYADFKNDLYHYIIYRDKIFKVDLKNPMLYKDARKYGISIGIPEYQVNFVPTD